MAAPLITDPAAVPVVRVDTHLPPVDPARLTPQALRHRFRSPPAWAPEFLGDGGADDSRAPAPAAVLVPLVLQPEGVSVLLTRRTAHLRSHGGQISFPGGRMEPGDATAVDAALREAEEEVGLAPGCVEIVAELPIYQTVTRFEVRPVVGLVQPPLDLRPDPHEVAAVVEVPLAFLMDPSRHRRHRYQRAGQERHFYSMPWEGPGLGQPAQTWFIWGATAAMLRNLYALLSA